MPAESQRVCPTPSYEFEKYRSRGAYHWAFISGNPFAHHCPTVSRYRAILRSVRSWTGLAVADVGCGDGALTGMIARCGARVTGIDPSPLGRTLAIKKFEEHGLSGRFVENMSQCEPEEFDIVVCSEVIEHVVDPKVLLNQIAEALKPGGVCVLTTPIRLTEHPIDQNHVKEYFPTELVTLLRSHFEQVSLQKLMPADSLLIYYWRPNFLLRFGILRYVFNLLDIMFSYNIVEGINTLERYHTLQLAVAVKGDNAPR